jgi:hypothetical protein
MANLWSCCCLESWYVESLYSYKQRDYFSCFLIGLVFLTMSLIVPSGALSVCGWRHRGPDCSASRLQPLEWWLRHWGCARGWQAILPATDLPQQQECGAVWSQVAEGCVSQRWGIIGLTMGPRWAWHGLLIWGSQKDLGAWLRCRTDLGTVTQATWLCELSFLTTWSFWGASDDKQNRGICSCLEQSLALKW